jgi:hypothetical protein
MTRNRAAAKHGAINPAPSKHQANALSETLEPEEKSRVRRSRVCDSRPLRCTGQMMVLGRCSRQGVSRIGGATLDRSSLLVGPKVVQSMRQSSLRGRGFTNDVRWPIRVAFRKRHSEFPKAS